MYLSNIRTVYINIHELWGRARYPLLIKDAIPFLSLLRSGTTIGFWRIMCGIHAVISNTAPAPLPPYLRACLCNRGPDHIGQLATRVSRNEDAHATFLTFTSTVLALRGDHLTEQPLIHPQTGSALCWNGEAWKVGGRTIHGNDGRAILNLLSEASASAAGNVEAILDVLLSIQGPFAFVYFDKPASKVYYGRDRLGRRSLLALPSQDGSSFAISSVTDTSDPRWEEVDADGIYVLDLSTESACPGALPQLLPTRYRYGRVADCKDLVSVLTGKFEHEVSCLSNLLV